MYNDAGLNIHAYKIPSSESDRAIHFTFRVAKARASR
jgi:hypothetical protein